MKFLFVMYLSKVFRDKTIELMFANIFKTDMNQVGQLLDNVPHEIVIDSRNILESSGSCYELSLFVPIKTTEQLGITNNLTLAIEVSRYLNSTIIVDDESDDPYQYLIIKNNQLFLTDYLENPQNCQDIQGDIKELDIEKALRLLNQYQNSNSAYKVKDSRLWLNCLK